MDDNEIELFIQNSYSKFGLIPSLDQLLAHGAHFDEANRALTRMKKFVRVQEYIKRIGYIPEPDSLVADGIVESINYAKAVIDFCKSRRKEKS
jgi:hypothetical protein